MKRIKIDFLKFILRLNIFCLIALLLSNCDSKKSTSTNTAIQPLFSSLYSVVISKNCLGCHEPQGSATQASGTLIDFSTQALAYQTLKNGTSTGLSANLSGQCNSVPLVSPYTPEDSYMLATLFTDYHHSNFYKNNCTPYSPSAHGATLDSAEKNAFVEWIRNGALNN